MRITRTANPDDLLDLLERPPRSTVAFNSGGTIAAMPVAFRFRQSRYLFGVSRGCTDGPRAGDEVKLLIDDGCYSFELRGTWVRGRVKQADDLPWDDDGRFDWLEVVPDRRLAWDYGRVRRAEDDGA